MADDPTTSSTKPLHDCLEVVQHLKEENQELRESADAFGELAERLNVALREEREATAAAASGVPEGVPIVVKR